MTQNTSCGLEKSYTIFSWEYNWISVIKIKISPQTMPVMDAFRIIYRQQMSTLKKAPYYVGMGYMS
jgi:hypothetical protein